MVAATVTKATTIIPPCPYGQLFKRTVSNTEGDEILVWKGSIDCVGVLTIITGGCPEYGPWSIRVKNADWDSGWIEVSCTWNCSSFRVIPGELEVWVGWCKGHICTYCIDSINIAGILSQAEIICLLSNATVVTPS